MRKLRIGVQSRRGYAMLRRVGLLGTVVAAFVICCGSVIAPSASGTTIPNPLIQFVTKYTTPQGKTVITSHRALVEATLRIDVTGDGKPDLSASLSVQSPSKFQLKFARLSTAPSGSLPLLAEAVVTDLTAGSLPRQNIAFGFDSAGGSTPSSWIGTATLGGTAPSTTLDVTTAITKPGAAIATVGGLFNGSDVLNPVDPIAGHITYTPAPSSASMGITMGPTTEVRAGASSPVAAVAAAQDVSGQDAQNLDVGISALPESLKVDYTPSTSGASVSRTVSYSATAPIAAPRRSVGER